MVAVRENDDVPFSVIGSWGRLDSGNLVQQFSDVGNTGERAALSSPRPGNTATDLLSRCWGSYLGL